MSEEKKNKFLIHGGILAMAGIFVRIIGMVYRIPMVNIIGGEGNGIYSAAFNVYNFMLIISSYGLPMAVSKLISARFATKRYKSAANVFKCSLIFSVITGGIAAVVLFFGAGLIEKYLYPGFPGMAIPLRVLAPTVFMVAALGVFRGFFQGQGNMIPTAVSQIIEQIVNAFVSVLAAYLLIKSFSASAHASAYGAAGGTLGTAFGAASALFLVIFLYMVNRPVFMKHVRRDRRPEEANSDVYKLIAITVIPIILGQTFYNISTVIDDIMFNNIALSTGVSKNIALDAGNYSASFCLLINIPQGIASAMSASMLPSIVRSHALGDHSGIISKINSTLKLNMMIAIPSFIGFTVLGGPAIQLLFSKYDSVQGGMMLKIGAIAVVFYTLSTVTTSALQGINKMRIPVRHSFISLIFHVILVFVLLRFTSLGIYSLVIGTTTFPILITVLNLVVLYQEIGYVPEVKKTFLIPLAAGVVMGGIALLSYNVVFDIVGINAVAFFVAVILAVACYFGILFGCKKIKLY